MIFSLLMNTFEPVLWKEVGGIIGFIIAGIFGYFIPLISKKIKGYYKEKFFMASLKKSLDMKIKLAEIKSTYAAQRLYLYQFHNGKIYVGDTNFHKYNISAIFELVSPGYSVEIQNLQGLPIDIFSSILTYMISHKQDIVVIGDHSGTDMTFDECGLDTVKYTMNLDTKICVKVENKNGNFVGILSFWFDKKLTKKQFADKVEDKSLQALLAYLKVKL